MKAKAGKTKTRKATPKTRAKPKRSPEKKPQPSPDEAATSAVEKVLLENALEGHVTAQVFWLCNRQPERWKSNSRVPLLDAGGPLTFTDFMRCADEADHAD